MSAVLQLEGVFKEYDGSPPVRVLDDVTLSIDAGELAVVVGASGSGKTTLLNVVGTLARPTAGKVRLEGRDVGAARDRALAGVRADRIGFVFQQFHLLNGVSALDNVAAGLVYRGVSRRKRREAAEKTLHRVGLGERIGHKPNQLSGGERQRVAIARAIVGDPAIVLADEPTGNLDSRNSAGIVDLIHDLNRNGSTILMITHDHEIAEEAPRRITLTDGRISNDTATATGAAA